MTQQKGKRYQVIRATEAFECETQVISNIITEKNEKLMSDYRDTREPREPRDTREPRGIFQIKLLLILMFLLMNQ